MTAIRARQAGDDVSFWSMWPMKDAAYISCLDPPEDAAPELRHRNGLTLTYFIWKLAGKTLENVRSNYIYSEPVDKLDFSLMSCFKNYTFVHLL